MDQLTPNDGQIPDKKPAIVVLSASGLKLARKVARTVDADIHGHAIRCPEADVSFVKARPHIAELFAAGRPIIGICAAGILIRSIAPYLQHKSRDAAVLAVSETGAHVVPLIGGHHGAITPGAQVTRALAATLAVTTAGNLQWNASLDEPPAGWRLVNTGAAARVMPQLLAGDGAFLDGEALPDLNDWFAHVPRGGAVTLTATRQQRTPTETQLVFCPQDILLGVGCARGAAADEVIDLVMAELQTANINAASIAAVVTADIKADEPAIHALASMLAVPLRVFDRDVLAAQAPRLHNPSDAVQDEIGIPGVAEAAALAAAGLGAMQLWRPKGGRLHRQLGYLWAALMAGVAISGLFIHELRMIGPFSPIHLLSLITLASLWIAISRARRRDIAGHRRVMLLLFWLALGLAGAFTFWPGRVMHEVLFGA